MLAAFDVLVMMMMMYSTVGLPYDDSDDVRCIYDVDYNCGHDDDDNEDYISDDDE